MRSDPQQRRNHNLPRVTVARADGTANNTARRLMNRRRLPAWAQRIEVGKGHIQPRGTQPTKVEIIGPDDPRYHG